MLDKVLLKFIEENCGKGTVTVPEDVMSQYLDGCKSALEGMFSNYKSLFPTVSDLAGEPLKMWCRKNYPDIQEEFNPELRMTFWQGHVIEAMLIALLKLSGHPITGEQERVYLHDEEIPDPIRGRMDITTVIAGTEGVVDIKTAHTESFESKWRSHDSLTLEDKYGYNAQGGAYELASGKPFLGWLVFNKDNSRLRFVEADKPGQLVSSLSKALGNVEQAYKARPTLPEEYEYYLGEPTGNIRVPPHWARSPYARALWPTAVWCKRGKQTLIYTKFDGIKIPGVKRINNPTEQADARN